jgi:hypothetical protein
MATLHSVTTHVSALLDARGKFQSWYVGGKEVDRYAALDVGVEDTNFEPREFAAVMRSWERTTSPQEISRIEITEEPVKDATEQP